MKLIRLSTVILVLTTVLFYSPEASAQIEIGVKVSPSSSFARVIAKDQHNFENGGGKANFGIGIIGDYFFGTNYALSSGLLFNTKGATVSYDYTAPDAMASTQRIKDEFSLQYLEIPVTLKLFTNEIAPDVRLYFQAGLSLNTMLGARVGGKKVESATGDKFTKRFNLFEIDALVAAGAEWQLGQSTKLFGGLSYHRGLTDIDDYYEEILNDKKVEVKNNSVALDLGIKF